MRNSVKKISASRKRSRYLSPTTVMVAVVILAIGTVTVASRQKLSSSNESNKVSEVRSSSSSFKVAGQDSALNFQNNQDQLTSEETARLANGLSEVIDQSTEGLSEIKHADGSVSISLEDRFQNVSVARVDQNGNLSQSCVDNPQAAGAFFHIDPKLIKNQRLRARPTN